ncbi:MAG TPA: hypothetical protein VGG48_08070 [Rhizomicrobium sp.]|jgi:hypothetical protein
MFCHAIFAFFCVSLPIGQSTAHMDNMGFGGVVTVEAPGWSVFLGMGTDAPTPMNERKLAKYCDSSGKCILYYRHCPDAKHCEFDFAINGGAIPVRITADDAAAGARALDSIGYALDQDKPQVAVPLSQFTVESKDDKPPFCELSGTAKNGCPKQ